MAGLPLPFERLAILTMAIFIFLHVCFLELLAAPGVFAITPPMRLLLAALPYKTFFAASVLIVLFAACWNRFTYPSMLAVCGAAALVIIGVARMIGVRSAFSSPAFLIFLAATPFLYRGGASLLKAVAWAVMVNAVFAALQLLYYGGFVSGRFMPVIPMAYGTGVFFLNRPSGFYFQPTAAGALFGFAALIFRSAGDVYRSFFFKIVFGISFVALLLTQAWAATLVFAVFYAFIFLRGGEAAVYAVVIGSLASLGAVREYVSHEFYGKTRGSLSIKVELIRVVTRYLAANPFVLFFGESLAGGQSELNRENSFLDLILQYGLILVATIYALILRIALSASLAARKLPLSLLARRRVGRIALVPLYPFVLVFTQNSAFTPQIAMLFVLSLAILGSYVFDIAGRSRFVERPDLATVDG